MPGAEGLRAGAEAGAVGGPGGEVHGSRRDRGCWSAVRRVEDSWPRTLGRVPPRSGFSGGEGSRQGHGRSGGTGVGVRRRGQQFPPGGRGMSLSLRNSFRPAKGETVKGHVVHCGNLGVMSCEPATLRQGWELWILPRHCLQEQGIQSISGCTWGTARGPRDSSRSLLILT